jgi:hypothetical protein
LPIRAISFEICGEPRSSTGGAAMLMICRYSPNSSIWVNRTSISTKHGMFETRLRRFAECSVASSSKNLS